MKELSVVIPMFNSGRFVNKAIDSILLQRGVDVEIVVVDDGSTDNSCSQLRKYGDRIKLIRKENGGASSARNVGLLNSSGRFVMYLDADDYVDDNQICACCIEALKRESFDFCMFRMKYFNEETQMIVTLPGYPKCVLCASECEYIAANLVRAGLFLASPCFKIINRDFLLRNKLFFEEGFVAEDIDWFVKLLIAADKICVLDEDAYVYRKGIQTSVTGNMTLKKCRDLYKSLLRCIATINDLKDGLLKRTLLSAMTYEYCILLGNVSSVGNKELLLEVKKLSYLFNYTMFPKTKYVNILYNVFGFRLTSKMLGMYIKRFAKSSK